MLKPENVLITTHTRNYYKIIQVEMSICNQQVGGSSPSTSSIKKSANG